MEPLENDFGSSKCLGLVGTTGGMIYSENGLGGKELRDLATDIVEEYLGSVCAAVAMILMRYGGPKGLEAQRIVSFSSKYVCTSPLLQDESVFSKLSLDSVKDALVVMLRHNIVFPEAREINEPQTLTNSKALQALKAVYRFCPIRALMLMRHGWVLDIISRYHSEGMALLCEELLTVGCDSQSNARNGLLFRILLNDPADAVIQRFRKGFLEFPNYSEDWEDALPESATMKNILEHPFADTLLHEIDSMWNSLTEHGIIIPRSKFTLSTQTQNQLDQSSTRTRVVRKRKTNSEMKDLLDASIEEKNPMQTALEGCPELRIQLDKVISSGAVNQQGKKAKTDNTKASVLQESMKSNVNSAKQRGSSKTNIMCKAPIEDAQQATYYQVNWNYFLQRVRAEMICEYWRDKGKVPIFGDILQVVCDQSIKSSAKSFSAKSQRPRVTDNGIFVDPFFQLPSMTNKSVDEATICGELTRENEKLRRMDAKTFIGSHIQVLKQISDGLVKTSGSDTSRKISVNFDGAIRLIKRRCVLKQVETEHGLDGLRITNLLLDLKALEEKEVGDLGMLDPRAARVKLYSLFRSGYLILEETSRKADLNPSYAFYLYRAEMEQMESVVACNVLKALLNLRIVKRKYLNQSKRFEEVKVQFEKYNSQQISLKELKAVQGFDHYLRLQFYVEHLEECIENLDMTCVLLTSIQELNTDIE